MVASECAPFAKTGGLGDVVGALPQALERIGHEVRVVLPFYGNAPRLDTTATGKVLRLDLGGRAFEPSLLEARLPGSKVVVQLVAESSLFGRTTLYGEAGDYPDNDVRFILLCRAALEACRATGFCPDVIHAHDWQAAAVPILLRWGGGDDAFFSRTATVFSIHNLAFQGLFPPSTLPLLGLGPERFTVDGLEYYGGLSLLKGALLSSDMISTVSPSYAREILEPEFGFGLEGVLATRTDSLVGILNGIDEAIWDPRTDPVLPTNYGPEALEGKGECRAELESEAGLAPSSDPLLGFVGRLTDQKGLDLLENGLPRLLELGFRTVILGTGEPRYHDLLWGLAGRYSRRLRSYLTFDEELSHRIFAGSDLCLMPSRFEPCGLNQMIALHYGTLPVVTSVGGLRDTVVDATPANLRSGIANGFVLGRHDPDALVDACLRARYVRERRRQWRELVRTGMEEDFSWARSARDYVALYERALTRMPRG